MDDSLIRRVTVGRSSGTDAGFTQRIWVCECEIGGVPRIASVLPPTGETRARAVVRLHGQPLEDRLQREQIVAPVVDQQGLRAVSHAHSPSRNRRTRSPTGP